MLRSIREDTASVKQEQDARNKGTIRTQFVSIFIEFIGVTMVNKIT